MNTGWVPIEHYDPVGGNLALDLANTASRKAKPDPQEKLRTYEDLLVWGERTGALDAERADALRAEAGRQPEAAAAVLMRTLGLRETIYRIFSAVGEGREPARSDLDGLGVFLEEGARHRRLAHTPGGWHWHWEADEDPLALLLWPTAYAAADLLTEGDLTRVKECGNDDCSWLFVDMSKNRSRRWCDMKDCGNRAKARRHYRRQKKKAE